ncbi:MAG: hypothetical protein J3Q66DRAFT_52972 [Benniella sp.]|nr:MAG: hypothetical protein J3Q66DRAFT_52972 [Benniella sp.]
MQDICKGFDRTLESFILILQNYSTLDDVPLTAFNFLPHLTFLDIRLSSHSSFACNSNFLQGCPALQTLRIAGCDRKEVDLTSQPQEPWCLPELESLTLEGTVCDVFNYGTFVNSPKLHTVRLERSFKDVGVRMVHEEYLEQLSRPSWSWNWSLSRLRVMKLRGYPAHLFRPSLLLGCPKLERLELDLDEVSRTVSKGRDLVLGYEGFDSPVRNLTLKGRWIMNESPDLFQVFFQTWFNGVQYLHMDATKFESQESMVSGLRSLKNLRKSILRCHQLSKYDACELGLEDVTSLRCTREWDIKNRTTVSLADGKMRRRLARERAEEVDAKVKRFERLLLEPDSPDIVGTPRVLNPEGETAEGQAGTTEGGEQEQQQEQPQDPQDPPEQQQEVPQEGVPQEIAQEVAQEQAQEAPQEVPQEQPEEVPQEVPQEPPQELPPRPDLLLELLDEEPELLLELFPEQPYEQPQELQEPSVDSSSADQEETATGESEENKEPETAPEEVIDEAEAQRRKEEEEEEEELRKALREVEALRQAEEEAREEEEAVKQDLENIQRCIYVFKGRRYHTLY